jgi:hypothetical protein
MQKKKYGSLFIYGTLQFCGNTEEYFSKNSRRLVVFLVLPRLNNTGNIIRYYQNGKLNEERKVISSHNMLFYYLLWYMQYLWILTKYYSKNERIIVISGHPISFLGLTLQRLIRKITYVYWVCDYFPPNSLINKIFTKISYHYHNRLKYKIYLSDRLNKKMNGSVKNTNNTKTIMWGVKELSTKASLKDKIITLCFVGVIRPSQGLDATLQCIKDLPFVKLKIIGSCNDTLYRKIIKKIKQYKLSNRVYFPNKFYYGQELADHLKSSSIGVALYDVGPEHGTFYADPAKIKTYTEYGLPVMMTDAAEIAQYIKEFRAGEIVERNVKDITRAINNIKQNYDTYIKGVKRFNNHFSFETYYAEKFSFLERL